MIQYIGSSTGDGAGHLSVDKPRDVVWWLSSVEFRIHRTLVLSLEPE
jgi:hypothetical protein